MLKIITNQKVLNGFIEFSYPYKIKVTILVYMMVSIIGIYCYISFLILINSDLLHLKPLKIALNYPEKAIISDSNLIVSSDLLSRQIPKFDYLTVGISI